MNFWLKKILKRMIIAFIVATIICVIFLLISDIRSLGRIPQGNRLVKIENSPNYQNGKFKNIDSTTLFVDTKNRKGGLSNLLKFIFRGKNKPNVAELPIIKTNLFTLPKDENFVVWFGHSSYLLQIDGIRYLIDPVFYYGSPIFFINRGFKGTNIYKAEDIPHIDYLIITHDHYDHLDYKAIKKLKQKVDKYVTTLGVGSHLEYWGIDSSKIIELDWWEEYENFVCCPTRHFSGRSFKRDKTLWGSFILKTPSLTIYIGGDSGYGSHFKAIGEKYDIDIAFIENGQYNTQWAEIHTLPKDLGNVMLDLRAKRYITVHHSKFALSTHSWDEPLKNEIEAAEKTKSNLIVLTIGEKATLQVMP